MARNRSEKLPRCPDAHAYADTVEAGRLSAPRLSFLWGRMPSMICNAIADERRHRKSTRGDSYLSGSHNDRRRDYRINAAIIREWYAT